MFLKMVAPEQLMLWQDSDFTGADITLIRDGWPAATPLVFELNDGVRTERSDAEGHYWREVSVRVDDAGTVQAQCIQWLPIDPATGMPSGASAVINLNLFYGNELVVNEIVQIDPPLRARPLGRRTRFS